MTNSNQQTSAATASRRPRASTTIDRKRVARPVRDGSIISRTSEMVVKRSASQQQAQTQSQRPQYSQQAQMMQQQMQKMQSQQQMAQQQMSQQQQMMQQQQMQQMQSSQQQQMQSQQQMTQRSQTQAQMTPKQMQQMQIQQQKMEQQRLMQIASERMQQRMANKKQVVVEKETAKQMKETAIEKALESASRTKKEEKESSRIHFGFKRVVLALACAAVCVFAIVYFVDINSPSISLKVAAMQSGIEAAVPSFVPRDFRVSKVTSEEGKVVIEFTNDVSENGFTLIEEKSSWDSNALLNNFVRYEYGDDYTAVKEQGLTIYISASNAAWVNGGVVYRIQAPVNTLTKKQIKQIAVSL